jgi:hypothetical protein
MCNLPCTQHTLPTAASPNSTSLTLLLGFGVFALAASDMAETDRGDVRGCGQQCCTRRSTAVRLKGEVAVSSGWQRIRCWCAVTLRVFAGARGAGVLGGIGFSAVDKGRGRDKKARLPKREADDARRPIRISGHGIQTASADIIHDCIE